ncbi:MAG: AEC family transporter [Lachnospiraceae bacterium]|nr:AEC family transporter [Lachnospiraceae bacterium]
MQISILLAQQIVKLFLMILVGYILVKLKILDSKDSQVISKILLYAVLPCSIVSAFLVDITPDVVEGLKLTLVAAVLLQTLLLLCSHILRRIFRLDEVELTSVYYSNTGNLILPIVSYMLGADWIIYACSYLCVQTVFLWSHCRMLLSGAKEFHLKDLLLNINMIAVFVGLFLLITGFPVPELLGSTVDTIAATVGPLSMFVIGMLIADSDLKRIFTNPRIYFISFLRLICLPLLGLVILKISGLTVWIEGAKTLLMITCFAVASPTATSVTQFCLLYGHDSRYAGEINVMTTLLSIVSMPMIIALFQIFL